MNKVLVLFAAAASLSTAAFGNTIQSGAISPNATYLHIQTTGGTLGADTASGTVMVLDLFSLGMTSGQAITIRGNTAANFCSNTGCTVNGLPAQAGAQLIAAFSPDGIIAPNSSTTSTTTGGTGTNAPGANNLNGARITALLVALLGPSNIDTVPTFDHAEGTNIANDFLVAQSNVAFTGTNVNIPTGGRYLILAVYDSRYVDNSDPDSNIFAFVDFVPAAVPEPASIGMIGAGLLALGAWARRRRA